MSTITSLFDQAQLAEAAYANFFDDAGNLITTEVQLTKALTNSDAGGSFSAAQATEFVKHWKVVDQYTASGLLGITDGTGFSAQPRGQTTNNYRTIGDKRRMLTYIICERNINAEKPS